MEIEWLSIIKREVEKAIIKGGRVTIIPYKNKNMEVKFKIHYYPPKEEFEHTEKVFID